jgi:hypothetical protein
MLAWFGVDDEMSKEEQMMTMKQKRERRGGDKWGCSLRQQPEAALSSVLVR